MNMVRILLTSVLVFAGGLHADALADWQGVLTRYTDDSGFFRYKAALADKDKIAKIVTELGEAGKKKISTAERKATLINLYNAAVIHNVLKNYPTKSVLYDFPESAFFRNTVTWGDKTYTLDDLEKKLLIGTYKDARIHFAVNCASVSCPPLSRKAFTAANTENQLNQLTRRFLKNPRYNEIDNSGRKARVSELFKWYNTDFGDTTEFFARYGTDVKGYEIGFIPYNWNLNEAK